MLLVTSVDYSTMFGRVQAELLAALPQLLGLALSVYAVVISIKMALSLYRMVAGGGSHYSPDDPG